MLIANCKKTMIGQSTTGVSYAEDSHYLLLAKEME